MAEYITEKPSRIALELPNFIKKGNKGQAKLTSSQKCKEEKEYNISTIEKDLSNSVPITILDSEDEDQCSNKGEAFSKKTNKSSYLTGDTRRKSKEKSAQSNCEKLVFNVDEKKPKGTWESNTILMTTMSPNIDKKDNVDKKNTATVRKCVDFDQNGDIGKNMVVMVFCACNQCVGDISPKMTGSKSKKVFNDKNKHTYKFTYCDYRTSIQEHSHAFRFSSRVTDTPSNCVLNVYIMVPEVKVSDSKDFESFRARALKKRDIMYEIMKKEEKHIPHVDTTGIKLVMTRDKEGHPIFQLIPEKFVDLFLSLKERNYPPEKEIGKNYITKFSSKINFGSLSRTDRHEKIITIGNLKRSKKSGESIEIDTEIVVTESVLKIKIGMDCRYVIICDEEWFISNPEAFYMCSQNPMKNTERKKDAHLKKSIPQNGPKLEPPKTVRKEKGVYKENTNSKKERKHTSTSEIEQSNKSSKRKYQTENLDQSEIKQTPSKRPKKQTSFEMRMEEDLVLQYMFDSLTSKNEKIIKQETEEIKNEMNSLLDAQIQQIQNIVRTQCVQIMYNMVRKIELQNKFEDYF